MTGGCGGRPGGPRPGFDRYAWAGAPDIPDNCLMNITIAVAVITALSTLAATALTGIYAQRSAGRQLAHQRQLTLDQHEFVKADRLRDIRRQAYEAFLSKVDAAYRLLDQSWSTVSIREADQPDAGFAARRALDEALVRVQLEGPQEVAERGQELVRSVGKEFRVRQDILDANPSVSAAPADLDRTRWAKALAERESHGAGFVAAARHALS